MSELMNPFLYEENPYNYNPFSILGIKENKEATLSNADYRGQLIEEYAKKEIKSPFTGENIKKGEAKRASAALQNPVMRLAFSLIHIGL